METMKAELDECVALLRPHYPDATDEDLRARAASMRAERYEIGRWPSDEEIAARIAKDRLVAEEAAKDIVISPMWRLSRVH